MRRGMLRVPACLPVEGQSTCRLRTKVQWHDWNTSMESHCVHVRVCSAGRLQAQKALSSSIVELLYSGALKPDANALRKTRESRLRRAEAAWGACNVRLAFTVF
eukprot:5653658-Amphidinium_carterae.1